MKVLKTNSKDAAPQLALQNALQQPFMENNPNHLHPGVLYDTSVENTLTSMETATTSLK